MRRGTLKEFKVKHDLLTKSEREVLTILALTQETVGIIAFYDILERCGVQRLNGRPLQMDELLKVLEKMVPKNFVTFVQRKSFKIKDSFRRHFINEIARDIRLKKYILAIRAVLPAKVDIRYRPRSYDTCLREMQFSLLEQDSKRYELFKKIANQYFRTDVNKTTPTDFFFFNPVNKPFLRKISVELRYTLLQEALSVSIDKLRPIDDLLVYLNALVATDPSKGRFKSLLADGAILKGQFDKARTSTSFARQGWIAFLKGENEKAIGLYKEELILLKKTGRKKVYIEHLAVPFYLIALLKTNDRLHYTDILVHAQMDSSNNASQYIRSVVQYLRGQIASAKNFFTVIPKTSIDYLFKGLAACWTGQSMSTQEIAGLKKYYTAAKTNGYQWLEMEYAFILSKLDTNRIAQNQYAAIAKELEAQLGVQSMITAVRTMEKWERVLRSLESLGRVNKPTKAKGLPKEETHRLVWIIDIGKGSIQAKEQKRTKNGGWSKGKAMSYDNLQDGKAKGLTEHDRPLIAAILKRYKPTYLRRRANNSFEYDGLISFLVGHPLLFRHDHPTIPIEVTAIRPELLVEEKPGRFEIKFSHPIEKMSNSLVQETPTRFNYIEVSPMHLEIAKALEGEQSISIPIAAKSVLSGILKDMKELVPVHSSLAHSAEALPTQKGATTIHVHLLPLGNGFKLELFVKPATTLPPYFKSGKGRKEFVVEIDDQATLIQRDLKEEVASSQQVEAACPTLQEIDSQQGEWTFDETDTCLRILLELEPLKAQGLVQVEWPKGEKIKLRSSVGFGQFAMQIKRDNDWFGVTGGLTIDAQQVIDMKRLLELVAANDSQFIELSDGQFVALTKLFKKKLVEMNTFLTQTKNGMKVHGLAASAMEDFMSQVNELEVDAAWKKQVNRLKKAQKVKAVVPSTFQAELRSYQLEGYQWLSQLAAWGVGACLADDMGLGKTVQGLAVLVDRASDGPALVVAPASVCRNWKKEALKFAPTLRPIIFGAGDRKQTVKDLKKYDLLIITYGLLHHEAELLASKKFNTIILDEAQAIKNRTAKRSKAAMQLQGDFKILTTGTPIENHLGELWNLFHFLNPGLLGTHKDFQERYALPIEKYKDKVAQVSLKKLIQPFILRRRKNEVLEELPSKTEITLSVELSTAEKAFYEALRQRAVEKIETDLQEKGQIGMQVLAEITRLRQACCNPKLVEAGVDIESSKLRLFGETVEELLANGHKALVFSQFVGHLKIIADFLKKKKITYQYLDGQTSMKKREVAIDAFQAGQSDLFLISLKAGGVGLNLTAADYVIHMDPWWNPAVEDQASDRAHRIGQKRPVTIYRLVTEHTIEEKIVALHHQKRDLADSLLEGTERSGRMSSEELLSLIKEG